MKILTASHSTKPSLTDDQVSRGFQIWDITVKSGCENGWWLAPTWEMVHAFKSGVLLPNNFEKEYFSLVQHRWERMITKEFPSHLILVCYCNCGEFCHRYLAAEFISEKTGAIYYGEHHIL